MIFVLKKVTLERQRQEQKTPSSKTRLPRETNQRCQSFPGWAWSYNTLLQAWTHQHNWFLVSSLQWTHPGHFINLTIIGPWAFQKAFCGSFTRLRQSSEERASKKRGHLKWESQASGGKEGKNFHTKGAQQQRKGRKQLTGMFEPLVIRRSYAPGKMGGYGRETAGRLPEAGWLTEGPLSLHLNKGPCWLGWTRCLHCRSRPSYFSISIKLYQSTTWSHFMISPTT